MDGFCFEKAAVRIAWAGLHFGEEPPITHTGGSGTIFITGCNLRCAFCQNYQISQQGMGKEVSQDEFSQICLALQRAGAENINIVTGSHAIPALAQYLLQAKKDGLSIPICWNCSAYETPEALQDLFDVVDIWLPDLKTLNPHMSEAIFDAADYPTIAKKAIRTMIAQSPLTIADDGKMTSGVIIRHLILPSRLDDTRLFLDWFTSHAQDKALLSLMSQYTPIPFSNEEANKRKDALSSFSNRVVSKEEFDAVQNLLEEYEINDGFYQELVQDTSWLPDFNKDCPFSSDLARPIWHWNKGFVGAFGSILD